MNREWRCGGLCTAFLALVSLLAVVAFTGCAEVRIGTESGSPKLKVEGLGSAYAGATAIHKYDGTIFRANLLRGGSCEGEIASVSIWPLCQLGVGVVGARMKLLWLDAGAGVLLYQPKAPETVKSSVEEKKKHEKHESEVDDEDDDDDDDDSDDDTTVS
jgi:hypothetical protein